MSDPSTPDRRRRAADSLPGLLASLQETAELRLGTRDAAGFVARLEASHLDVFEALDAVYGAEHPTEGLLARLAEVALQGAAERSEALRVLDAQRCADPAYWHRSRHVGYVAYADRFAGGLPGVLERADHLVGLGVTYLHLMPLLRPREGDSDGGYAVADYRDVDPRLGTVQDLEDVAAGLRERGVALCVDLVLNHTAREHPWARAAAAGDARYRAYYRVFPDRSVPDAYEATLPEVFPDTAPGSFTWDDEVGGWVWTTFRDFQWDLDWSNPDVFAEMLAVVLWLADRGVEVVRLDAVPFLWKRLGTDCQNQPEAHWLLQALRGLTRVAAPAVVFQAEAIVPPGELVQYLGAHDRFRPECDLAYHNQLMVQLWSSAAARDARVATRALRRMRPPPPTAGWVTYLRCHDDVGWAVDDDDARAVGWDGAAHRRFLAQFYAGRHPGSFAEGDVFQENPLTGDARTSGGTAALCGLTQAERLGDPALLEAAVRRLLLLYGVVFSYGGLPLLYMGDEVALPDDEIYRGDPALAVDNRWRHRPWMDWDRAALAEADPASVPGRVLAGVRGLVAARRRLLALRGGGETTPLEHDAAGVLAYRRQHPRSGPLLALANLTDVPASVDAALLERGGVSARCLVAHGSGEPLDLRDGRLHLAPLGFAWLVHDDGTAEGVRA